MADLAFSIHTIASFVALTASYALLMSLLKKPTNLNWTQGEAVLVLIGTGVSFGVSYVQFFVYGHVLTLISEILLTLSLLGALIFVLYHRFGVKNGSAIEEKANRNMLYGAIMLFILLALHVLSFFGGLTLG